MEWEEAKQYADEVRRLGIQVRFFCFSYAPLTALVAIAGYMEKVQGK